MHLFSGFFFFVLFNLFFPCLYGFDGLRFLFIYWHPLDSAVLFCSCSHFICVFLFFYHMDFVWLQYFIDPFGFQLNPHLRPSHLLHLFLVDICASNSFVHVVLCQSSRCYMSLCWAVFCGLLVFYVYWNCWDKFLHEQDPEYVVEAMASSSSSQSPRPTPSSSNPSDQAGTRNSGRIFCLLLTILKKRNGELHVSDVTFLDSETGYFICFLLARSAVLIEIELNPML